MSFSFNPPPLEIEYPNVGCLWPDWIKCLEYNFLAAGISESKKKEAMLFSIGGLKLMRIYEGLDHIKHTDADVKDYELVKFKLNTYFSVKKSWIVESVKFAELRQEQSECIDAYVARLRIAAEYCEFSDIEKELCRHIARTCYSMKLKTKLLESTVKTLDELLKMGRALEAVGAHIESLVSQSSEINYVGNKTNRAKTPIIKSSISKKCFKCGGTYPHEGKCPAANAKCSECGKLGHFSSYKFCKGKTSSPNPVQKNDKVDSIHVKLNELSSNPNYIFAL